jgi:hypothetical protein
MLSYQCEHCGMQVKGLSCGHCNTDLVHRVVTKKDGQTVQVAECPKGCGKIKSPACCGHDMTPQK